ncbi:MAG: FG-GAP repeat domain-containing protein [Segetibacter sp.]
MIEKLCSRLLLILSGAVLLWSCVNSRAQQTSQEFKLLKYNNPGLVVNLGVGLWAWPLPMDYDNDGDMDLLVSSQGLPYNGLYFFENKSGDKNPVFAKPVWLSKSINDIQLSVINGKPRITVPGAELLNFKTTFASQKKSLLEAYVVKKLMKGKVRFNQWKLVDFDNDGDEDIAVGIDDWGDYGWDNAYNQKGEWTNGPLHGYVYLLENKNGEYTNTGRMQAGGHDIDVYGAPTPNFADFDGDGDLDLICGQFVDKLTYFENVGTKEKPTYASGKYLANASGVIQMDLEMIIPVSVDWDKDGDADLIVGDEDGRVAFIENTGKLQDGMPQFKSPVYFKQEADDVKFGALPSQQSVDWDDDGDEDLISGNSAGYIGFIENLGMFNGMPRWAAPKLLSADGKTIRIQAGLNGSIQGPAEQKWGYTTVSVADWDNDGLKDIIVNSIFGKVIWFKNIGTSSAPRLAAAQSVMVDWMGAKPPKPSWLWWDPHSTELVTLWRTTPFTTDWNKDGLVDLIMLDTAGYLSYFERFKKGQDLMLKPPARIFYGTDYSGYGGKHGISDSTPGLLKLNTSKFGGSGRVKFTMADWNQDGKSDILVTSNNVTVMKNLGVKDGVVQLKNGMPLTKQILAGHDTSPTVVDWDKNGVPDMLLSAEDGHFYYLKNNHRKR